MSKSLRPVSRALFAFFVAAVGGCSGSGGNDPTNPDTHLAVLGLSDTNVVDLTQVISTLLKDSLIILAVLSPWVVLLIASRRFEKRRRDQGVWNESGPIDPTYASTNPTLRAVGMRGPTIEPGSRGYSFDLPSEYQLNLPRRSATDSTRSADGRWSERRRLTPKPTPLAP